jgi:membrane-associated phospholipid phosphatase
MLRRSEIVLVVYLSYAAAVSIFMPRSSEVRTTVLLLNATVIAGLHLLAFAHSLRRNRVLGALRDWLPTLLILLSYRQMGWIGRPPVDDHLERAWLYWDRIVLYDWGLCAAIEVAGPLLPALLELAYALVSTIPLFCVAMLAAYRHSDRIDRVMTVVILGGVLSYALFPFVPSEPPRSVFPGADLPSYDTLLRRFNLWLLGGLGIHASVFPSAHVSLAFAAAAAMRRGLSEHPWVGRYLWTLAVFIAVATVYGRYHYFVDAVAGLIVAVVAVAVGRAIARPLKRL